MMKDGIDGEGIKDMSEMQKGVCVYGLKIYNSQYDKLAQL